MPAKIIHQLSRADARRIAVRAQLLERPRPTDLLDVVRQLTLLQIDPTAAVAPSAELVLWSRLGNSTSPDQLATALEKRTLIELRAMIRPAEDLSLYRAEMSAWPGEGMLGPWLATQREWLRANDSFRRDVLARLKDAGPLRSRDLPDTCTVPWVSKGWSNNRNVAQLLEFLEQRGEVAVAGRQGRDRLWDLADRVYPDDPVVPPLQALRTRNERRLRALGIARVNGPQCPVEPMNVGDVGEPAVVAGVGGEWRVDPAALGEPLSGRRASTARAALLSPFDRLLHDRQRAIELFEFDYQLGIYQPAAKRRWGYYALPILYGDRLIGKLDATADRKAGVFRVAAIHRDVEFTKTMTAAVDREIAELSRWLELELRLP